MRLRYWIKEALKFIGIIMIGMLAVVVMQVQTQDVGETWKDQLGKAVFSVIPLGAFLCMIFGVTVYQLHIPLAICFGSTRKEVFLGMQCYRLVIACAVLAVAVLLLFVCGDMKWEIVPLGAAAFLVFNGLSAIFGGLSTRMGRVALMVVQIAGYFLCVAVIILTALIIVHQGLLQGGLVWIVLGFGILVYCLCMIYEFKTIKKFSVR